MPPFRITKSNKIFMSTSTMFQLYDTGRKESKPA